MIGWASRVRQRWVERQAYRWVMHMLDDPTSYAAGLERWLSKAPDHRVVYKRVAIEVGYASDAARQIPGLRVAAVAERSRTFRSASRNVLLPVGLTAALVILSLVGWHALSSNWSSVPDRNETRQTFAIGQGRRAIRLDDGSVVTLSGVSAVVVRYAASERAVDLGRGHARFSVQHDPSRPFVVYVGGGKVTAVGTEFEVEAGERIIVKLLSGRVIVTQPPLRPSSPPGQVILTTGQPHRAPWQSPCGSRRARSR